MLTIGELSVIHPADRIASSQIVSTLRREWCPFAERTGRCDHMCSANSFCVQHITEILNIKGEPRSFQAVLLFRCRAERAKIADVIERPRLDVNKFGETKTDWQNILRRAGGTNNLRSSNPGTAQAK